MPVALTARGSLPCNELLSELVQAVTLLASTRLVFGFNLGRDSHYYG
jgi:hypothetical protein